MTPTPLGLPGGYHDDLPPDEPAIVGLDMMDDPDETKRHLEKIAAAVKNAASPVPETKVLFNVKVVDVGCVGFVLTLHPELVGNCEIDQASIRAAYEKHFPGKPVVVLTGFDCQPIYANDEHFKRAVAEAVKEIVDKQLIEVHKQTADDVGKAIFKNQQDINRRLGEFTFEQSWGNAMVPDASLGEVKTRFQRGDFVLVVNGNVKGMIRQVYPETPNIKTNYDVLYENGQMRCHEDSELAAR